MTRKEYIKHIQDDPDWEPGWEAICEVMEMRYGAGSLQEISSSAGSLLEGYGLCHSRNGYFHVVSKGLSQIRPNLDAMGGARSGWGFELTAKWPDDMEDSVSLVYSLMERIAEYINAKKLPVRRFDVLAFDDELRSDVLKEDIYNDTMAAVMLIKDTELNLLRTCHGAVDFLQMVNVRCDEQLIMKSQPQRSRQLAHKLKVDYPYMEIDIDRKKAYLV